MESQNYKTSQQTTLKADLLHLHLVVCLIGCKHLKIFSGAKLAKIVAG